MTAPTPENITPNPTETPAPTQQETQQAVQQATENVETMTPQAFRDWMDSLPDKIADAIDVKIGERRAASGSGSQTAAQPAATEDKKSGGFLGTGKSFGEFWFGN